MQMALTFYTRVQKALNITLAVSLVHLFPPKHHPRALGIIDQILSSDPHNVPSLMGRGYIMQRLGKWDDAATMFAGVLMQLPEDDPEAIRAKEEHAWCLIQVDAIEEGITELNVAVGSLQDFEGKEEDMARCLWRLGQAFWKRGGSFTHPFHTLFAEVVLADHFEEAYRHYIKSLKCLPSFAPAFTSLGIYYLEAAQPPDPNRASKCFQKAFELDAREGYAAQRLAEGFAEEREWDLVEVVAKRTIEGEGGAEEGSSETEVAAAARYLPTNAWAWKAMGVVYIVSRMCPKGRLRQTHCHYRTDSTILKPSTPFR